MKTYLEWLRLREAYVPGQGAGSPFGDEGKPQVRRGAGDPFGGETGRQPAAAPVGGNFNKAYVLQKLSQLDSTKMFSYQDLVNYFGSPEAVQFALQQNSGQGVWRQYGQNYSYVQMNKWDRGMNARRSGS